MKNKKGARVLMFLAAISMLLLFAFPLWKITLSAPQYPDGISMYIWINKITGDTDYTIQNINILNHYVGMKYIEPEMFPELTYFPIVVGVMATLGLLFAFLKKPNLYLTWFILLFVLGVLGMYDFYLWEYDYGHNLSETAPIKVPGMAYQPPLFGSKMLLNFKADSYPHIGGIAFGMAAFLSLLAFLMARKEKSIIAPILLIAFLTVSCSTEPQKIAFGTDSCSHCHMTIADQRYGAEIVTKKGKAYKFDATECLINFINEESIKVDEIHSRLLIDFLNPGEFLVADQSFIMRSPSLPSPMGMYLTVIKDEKAAERLGGIIGSVYSWEELLSSFEKLPKLESLDAGV